jgi:hypothetical protein
VLHADGAETDAVSAPSACQDEYRLLGDSVRSAPE